MLFSLAVLLVMKYTSVLLLTGCPLLDPSRGQGRVSITYHKEDWVDSDALVSLSILGVPCHCNIPLTYFCVYLYLVSSNNILFLMNFYYT